MINATMKVKACKTLDLIRFGINTAASVAAGVSSTADRTWSIRVTQVEPVDHLVVADHLISGI